MKKMLLKEDKTKFADNIKYDILVCDETIRDKVKAIDDFNCGNENIDKYLKEKCIEDLEKGLGLTKVVLNNENQEVIGFYTLCTTAIIYNISNKNHYIPAMEIKYFAINEKYQGMVFEDEDYEGLTLSDMLFSSIIKEINDISSTSCGIHSIVLYSVPKAYNFYKKNFFEDFNKYMLRDEGKYISDCIPMFVEL